MIEVIFSYTVKEYNYSIIRIDDSDADCIDAKHTKCVHIL